MKNEKFMIFLFCFFFLTGYAFDNYYELLGKYTKKKKEKRKKKPNQELLIFKNKR